MIRNIDTLVNLESKTSHNFGSYICFLFIPNPVYCLVGLVKMELGFDGFLKKSFHVIDKFCKDTEDPKRVTD